jgi:hypothetical protein
MGEVESGCIYQFNLLVSIEAIRINLRKVENVAAFDGHPSWNLCIKKARAEAAVAEAGGSRDSQNRHFVGKDKVKQQ